MLRAWKVRTPDLLAADALQVVDREGLGFGLEEPVSRHGRPLLGRAATTFSRRGTRRRSPDEPCSRVLRL